MLIALIVGTVAGMQVQPVYAPLQMLTEHWNGSNWSIVSSPSPGTYNGNELYGVAAISTNDVWAVGGTGQVRQDRTVAR